MGDEQVTVNGLAKGLTLLIQAMRESNNRALDQLDILSYQVEYYKEIAERLENLEARFETVLSNFQSICKMCSRLNILCSDVGIDTKGPQDGKDRKTLPNWS